MSTFAARTRAFWPNFACEPENVAICAPAFSLLTLSLIPHPVPVTAHTVCVKYTYTHLYISNQCLINIAEQRTPSTCVLFAYTRNINPHEGRAQITAGNYDYFHHGTAHDVRTSTAAAPPSLWRRAHAFVCVSMPCASSSTSSSSPVVFSCLPANEREREKTFH